MKYRESLRALRILHLGGMHHFCLCKTSSSQFSTKIEKREIEIENRKERKLIFWFAYIEPSWSVTFRKFVLPGSSMTSKEMEKKENFFSKLNSLSFTYIHFHPTHPAILISAKTSSDKDQLEFYYSLILTTKLNFQSHLPFLSEENDSRKSKRRFRWLESALSYFVSKLKT